MAYYVLQKGYELCGWKGLPFALRYPDPHFADFFDKESYRVVYALDGRHDIDEDGLTIKQKKLLDRLKTMKIAVPSDGKTLLEPWQEYKSFPAMYKNSVQWSITGRCNYNCRHCFMSAPDYRGEDMTLEQSTHILDELVLCGIRSVAITGGEPLVNPHFYEILDAIKERGLLLDTLYTNSELVDDYLLDELDKRQMNPAFHMSFDGVGWHDWLRGVKGAEDTVIRKFQMLRERNFQTSTSMCLHRHNIGNLKENIDLLSSLGLVHVKMNVASPMGRWKNETEHFLSQDEAYEAILDYIPQYIADGIPVSAQFCGLLEFDKREKKTSIPYARYDGEAGAKEKSACSAVRRGLYINASGRVLPCMTLAGSAIEPLFPSMLETPLSEILSDSFYRDTCLMKMGACIDHNERCRKCAYRLVCGAGCRACACGDSSTDYQGIDEDTCAFFLHHWYEKAIETIRKYENCLPTATEQSLVNDAALCP